MKLQQALEQGKHGSAVKDTEDGTYTVDKANISGGYYKDFTPNDEAQRSPFNTSTYYRRDELGCIAHADEDGWQPR